MSTRIWLTTHEAAERAGCHRDTVAKACESGAMHGGQRTKNGRWRIHVDCLDAWVLKEPCRHQIAAAAS